MKQITPTKHYSSTLHQLYKLIPSHLTEKLARKHAVYKKSRTFTPWSHVVSLLFAQLTHAIGLNDVCDFLGHSKHAIRWQLWAAMLLYVLLRFIAFRSQWPHSFTRLFTIVRGVVWDRFGLFKLADFYGTARHRYRMCSTPQSAYLPGFAP